MANGTSASSEPTACAPSVPSCPVDHSSAVPVTLAGGVYSGNNGPTWMCACDQGFVALLASGAGPEPELVACAPAPACPAGAELMPANATTNGTSMQACGCAAGDLSNFDAAGNLAGCLGPCGLGARAVFNESAMAYACARPPDSSCVAPFSDWQWTGSSFSSSCVCDDAHVPQVDASTGELLACLEMPCDVAGALRRSPGGACDACNAPLTPVFAAADNSTLVSCAAVAACPGNSTGGAGAGECVCRPDFAEAFSSSGMLEACMPPPPCPIGAERVAVSNASTMASSPAGAAGLFVPFEGPASRCMCAPGLAEVVGPNNELAACAVPACPSNASPYNSSPQMPAASAAAPPANFVPSAPSGTIYANFGNFSCVCDGGFTPEYDSVAMRDAHCRLARENTVAARSAVRAG